METNTLRAVQAQVEKRSNKRPKLTDLKKRNVPAELADQVIFLYRDHYYNYNSDETAECIVAKTPTASPGTARLQWNREVGSFTDI